MIEVILITMRVNVDEVKKHFSELLARVRDGEEVIIYKSGKPAAGLISTKKRPIKRVKRVPGSAKSMVKIAEDFDAPLPQSILNAFEQ